MAEPVQVVLMEDYLDRARHLPSVQALAERVTLHIHTTRATSEADLQRRVRNAEIVITIRDRVTFSPAIFDAASRLKLLAICGPRVEPHVNLAAANRSGVLVCAAPKRDEAWSTHQATAELTWALILGLLKDLALNDRVIRAGGWQTRPGRDAAGRRLGVIGLGKVGRLVASIGRAMGLQVLAWGPRLSPEAAHAAGAEYRTLDELLGAADIVSLHANLTEESRNLLGTREIGQMRRGAILVNTARAALVNEAALRAALDGGRIAGAGLDVFWSEPLPADHWLRRHPAVLLQPHLGGFSEEGFEDLVAPAVEDVLAYLDGKPRNMVNPQVLGR
jgi:phosphoglycerate dehydrogenase-like enzyme